MNFGKWNVLIGGFGVIMVVKRFGEWDEKFDKWIKSIDYFNLGYLENGLYIGKIGIVNVLIEFGYIKEVVIIIKIINIEDSN